MLEAALRVVETARSLKLVQRDGKTSSDLSSLELARAIDGLRAAIEAFDAETGAGRETGVPKPAAKPDFAAPPQIEDDGFAARRQMLARIKAMQAPPDASEEPVLPDPVPVPAGEDHEGPAEPSPAMESGSASDPSPRHDFAEEGLFFDGDESAADLLLTMEAIDQKLAYAVAKVGWSPRLRALAAAQRIAHANMFIEVDGPGGWVRIPARNWGTLSLAIAEAALDQDLSLALPAPRPREPRPEYDLPVPRPKS